MKAGGKAVFIPPRRDQNSCQILIPYSGKLSEALVRNMHKRREVDLDNEGVLLPAIGTNLVKLYEEELGDLREVELNYLMEWLPRVFVDGLQMAEGMEITDETETISVKLLAPSFRHVCREPNSKIVCEKIGCPECSSIIEAIAKNSNRIIYFETCKYDPESRILRIVSRKGQLLDNLEKYAGDSG
jgi:hypothetical protein